MPNAKPIKLVLGQQEQFSDSDTILPVNLAPNPINGYAMVADDTMPEGKKWAPVTGNRAFAFFIS